MENEILVSVVCLTYNHEKYIEKAIKSMLNQETDFKYEIIVHDDCSQDATLTNISFSIINFPLLCFYIYTLYMLTLIFLM
jgi:glycosyltransferase involved in cell wall biosynthesis